MALPINSTPAVAALHNPRELAQPSAASSPDLGAAFAGALHQARALESSSQTASTRFAAGDPAVGIHEVVIESEKASIALRYATTLKNKAVEAYRELMNTQV